MTWKNFLYFFQTPAGPAQLYAKISPPGPAGIFIVRENNEHLKKKEDIMTNIIKRENANQPATFGSVVDQIFQNNLDRFFDDDFWGGNGAGRSQFPVNIRETDKSYHLELVAPGLSKQDFHLDMAGDNLTVKVEHKEENSQENKNEKWLRREYKKQSLTRSFHLDDTVDAGKISARYDNGVLYVDIPKKENAQKVSRTINIQ